jgi:hypothetical protein
MMALFEILIDSLAYNLSVKGHRFKVHIECMLTDDMVIPESLRTQHEKSGMPIGFILASENMNRPIYDAENKTLSFYVMFHMGIESTVTIPIYSITKIVDLYNDEALLFATKPKEQKEEPKKIIKPKFGVIDGGKK